MPRLFASARANATDVAEDKIGDILSEAEVSQLLRPLDQGVHEEGAHQDDEARRRPGGGGLREVRGDAVDELPGALDDGSPRLFARVEVAEAQHLRGDHLPPGEIARVRGDEARREVAHHLFRARGGTSPQPRRGDQPRALARRIDQVEERKRDVELVARERLGRRDTGLLDGFRLRDTRGEVA